MRPEVEQLASLGPIPGEDDDDAPLERWEGALGAIQSPLHEGEARVLVVCFPPDLAYGLGFSLLHLLESAPDWSDELARAISVDEWRTRARLRLANARKMRSRG